MKYHLISLGCQMNQSDSDRVITVLEGMGYERTENEADANLLGIIACSVRQTAIDKVYSKIHKWNKRKNSENLLTFISGCILPNDKQRFLKLFDIVFPMSELSALPDTIKSYGVATPHSLHSDLSVPKNDFIFDLWSIKPKRQSKFEAYVPIQNGCDKFCTFCAVPYTRGREVSRPSDDILTEVKSAVEQGYKSITLLGQNVNSYGNDKKGDEINFTQLLEKIGQYGNESNKEFWVYFTSPHPRDMKRDVIETIAKYKCLAKQIHLPLQSGDNKVLIRMNRNHSLDAYRKIVDDIRELIPQATLFTDIIVGFTGETDEQFENTAKAFEEFKFNMAYIAKYSPRPGAASYQWGDNVPHDDKKERYHRLTEILEKHAFAYNRQLIGKTLRVLVNGHDRKPGYFSGITEGKLVLRFAGIDESLLGQFVDVKITHAQGFSLEGERVEVKAEMEV